MHSGDMFLWIKLVTKNIFPAKIISIRAGNGNLIQDLGTWGFTITDSGATPSTQDDQP